MQEERQNLEEKFFVSYELRRNDPLVIYNYRSEDKEKGEGWRFDVQVINIYLTSVKQRSGSTPNMCVLGRLDY